MILKEIAGKFCNILEASIIAKTNSPPFNHKHQRTAWFQLDSPSMMKITANQLLYTCRNTEILEASMIAARIY